MEQRVETEETIKRFLLGDLPEQEQEEVQYRLLADSEYFEQFLMVENELTDDYVRGFLSEQDRERVTNYFLAVPERREKLRFAKALDKYVSAEEQSVIPRMSENLSTSPERLGRLRSTISRKRTRRVLPDESAAIPDQLVSAWSRILAEAAANREMLSSLVEHDWLGLHLVARVRSQSSTGEELASIVETSEAIVRPLLVRLVGGGIMDEDQGVFSCTKRGAEILDRIETITGYDSQGLNQVGKKM